MTYEDLKRVNEECKATSVKDKPYIEVNERIKAFRKLFPMGTIQSEMISNENGVCVFRAEVIADGVILGVGHAYEKETSSFINKTSYIENCQTSAVGRALGMAGFGIDTSVASAEEVQNAMLNQNKEADSASTRKATAKQVDVLRKTYTGSSLEKLLSINGVEKLEDLSIQKASELISKLGTSKGVNGNA